MRRLRPGVIYGLLNWRAVRFCHEVLTAFSEIPFVWHFKEAPQHSIRRGEWPRLAALAVRPAAQLYCSEEERDWFPAARSAWPSAPRPGFATSPGRA